MKIEIDLPDKYGKFLEYLELNFGINKKKYLEDIVKLEINSRNRDLKLF